MAGVPAVEAPPAAPAAPSKQTAVQHGDIYLVSERWSRDGDRIIADGNVELHYKNIILYADHLEADSRTKDVLAVGKVTLHIGEEPKKPKTAPGQVALDGEGRYRDCDTDNGRRYQDDQAEHDDRSGQTAVLSPRRGQPVAIRRRKHH